MVGVPRTPEPISELVRTTETEYLSVAEAASLLNLSEPTIYRRVWDGSLPIVRLSENGAIRIPCSAFELPVGAPLDGRDAA